MACRGWYSFVCLLVVGTILTTQGCFAQQAPASIRNPSAIRDAKVSAEPSFEVTTVKAAGRSPDGHTHINYPSGGEFSAINITLLTLMQWAYGMPERQILDGPAWLSSTRFDIEGKAEPELDSALRALPSEQERELKRHMVQALLADRFNLKVHPEVRTLPAYDLVSAKGGPKLQVSQAHGKTVGVGRTHFNGQGLTMVVIAEQLSQITGRVVIDKTSLPASYDLKLTWSADDGPANDDSAPSLLTAIQEQLGLRLESAKESVPVLVIDHVETASAN